MSHESHTDTLEKAPKSSIEIIFANHSLANLPKVAEAVLASDGDIIAIEKIREGTFGMGTVQEKADLSQRLTDFIAADIIPDESAAEHFGIQEPFFTTILDRLKGSGKTIVLLDMGTDDPGYALRKKSRAAINAISDFRDGTFDYDNENPVSLEDLSLDYHIASAQESEYREHVMRNQLLELAETHPGKKITAMIGATHTWISHNIPKNIDATRVFVPTDKDAALYRPGEKMHYYEPYVKSRIIRFNLKRFGLSVLDENGNLLHKSDAES